MVNAKQYNYSDDIQIDPDALDVEWVMQPQMFIKYGEALADAKLDLDRLKEKLELARADLDAEIRSDPEPFTGTDKKPTEAQVMNIIIGHPRYKEALSNLNEGKHTVEILAIAVRAFDQRKTALENLVRLHGQQYFAGPIEPRDLNLEFGRHAKSSSIRGKVHSNLNPDHEE